MNASPIAVPVPAPVVIVVTTRPVKALIKPRPSKARRLKQLDKPVVATAQLRNVWSAKFVGGPHDGQSATSGQGPDEVVGALIRRTADSYDTADEIVDFFASLFGHDPARTPDAHLARAVRLAAKNKKRI